MRPRGNSSTVIVQIRDRDGHACTRCGSTDRLKIHHITPVQHGGTDDPENLTTLCHACHEATHHGQR